MKHGRTALPMIVALAAALVAPPAGAASHLKRPLTPTGKDPDARGRAALVVRGSHGRLTIATKRLARGADFEVVVDGVLIGTLATSPNGGGKARFSTRPRGGDQLLGVDPRGKLVEVRDDEGDDVLETEMPDDSQPGEVRCCLAHQGETECESETPEACAGKGGVDMGAGSCMPNPCTPGNGDEIRCCIPQHDEDGPQCEDTTAAECSAAGGTNIGTGGCEQDVCSPTPPGDEEIRCCIPQVEAEEAGDGEHNGGEAPDCERLTAQACGALGGTSLGAGSCEPNPCMGSPSGAFLEPMIAVF